MAGFGDQRVEMDESQNRVGMVGALLLGQQRSHPRGDELTTPRGVKRSEESDDRGWRYLLLLSHGYPGDLRSRPALRGSQAA